jgi:hypothetical protein
LSWFLVYMSDLSMLTTMQSFRSKRSRVQALPLQFAQMDIICKLMLCPKFKLWNIGSGWKSWRYGYEKVHNLFGIFLATKMVVPLEKAQNTILALNRKRQFPLFNYGQYFYESSIWSQIISPQVFINFGDG